MEILIRQQQKSDLGGVDVLIVKAWHQAYCGILHDDILSSMTIASREDQRLSNPRPLTSNDIAYVAVDKKKGRVVGYFYAEYKTNHKKYKKIAQEGVWLHALYVLPEVWGQGVGQKLILNIAKIIEKKSEYITLCCLSKNTIGRSFYEKFGAKLLDKKGFYVKQGHRCSEVYYRFEISKLLERVGPL